MDEELYEALEYEFVSRWRGKVDGLEGGGAVIPDELYNALKTRLGKEFKAELVHALSDDSVAFLLVRDSGEAIKVSFDPQSGETTMRFLGSLVGGDYTETVSKDQRGAIQVEGVFTPPRDGEPIKAAWSQTPAQTYIHEGPIRARERTELLLQRFREWASQPPATG